MKLISHQVIPVAKPFSVPLPLQSGKQALCMSKPSAALNTAGLPQGLPAQTGVRWADLGTSQLSQS